MAEKDAITKAYMQKNTVFADAFNYFMYDGKQVINPDSLKPMDTTALALPYGDDKKTKSIQKYRDVLKRVCAMTDDNRTYLILGIENQSHIHYAMPVRNMLYDVIQYENQIREIADKHRKNNENGDTSDEYLSGFHKNDKLIPVITLTIYFGASKWDAPKDLHSMLDADEETLKFVDNYHLHLITPEGIGENDFSKFHSELKYLLKYIKHSSDKKALDEVVHGDEAYTNLSHETANAINILTGSKLKLEDNGKGGVDVCKAIDDMRFDAEEKGIEKGAYEGKIEIAIQMLADGTISHEKIATFTKLPLEKVEELAKSSTVSA